MAWWFSPTQHEGNSCNVQGYYEEKANLKSILGLEEDGGFFAELTVWTGKPGCKTANHGNNIFSLPPTNQTKKKKKKTQGGLKGNKVHYTQGKSLRIQGNENSSIPRTVCLTMETDRYK